MGQLLGCERIRSTFQIELAQQAVVFPHLLERGDALTVRPGDREPQAGIEQKELSLVDQRGQNAIAPGTRPLSSMTPTSTASKRSPAPTRASTSG